MIKILIRVVLLLITLIFYWIWLIVGLFLWAGGQFEMFDMLNKIFTVLFYIAGLALIIFEINLVKKAISDFKSKKLVANIKDSIDH